MSKFCFTHTDVMRYLKHETKDLKPGQGITLIVEKDKDGYYVREETKEIAQL